MPRSVLDPLMTLWSSAYLGSAAFLAIGLLPTAPVSLELVAELAWIGLLGSIATTLVLASAVWAARAQRPMVLTVFAAITALGFAGGWEHTDFLLSGPHWTLHPQRTLLRTAMAGAMGLLGGGLWLWLVAGARLKGLLNRTVWAVFTLVGVATLTVVIGRYRAYDYSLAQAVILGGVLCAAFIHLLLGSLGFRWRMTVGFAPACAFALLAAGSRMSEQWVATGEREVIAHSRAGGLVTLYVIPRIGVEESWTDGDLECPTPRPVVEQAPMWIPGTDRRNVIIITVDALRKDVVGTTRSKKPVTPELSRLEKRGISFDNATTTYPATLFAIGSAFTGLTPAELYLSPAMPDTIFSRTRTRVDRQLVVLPNVSWFRLPIIQEFLTPGVEPRFALNDAEATRKLVESLRSARASGDSVMAWVHYYSPHDPYQAHPSFSLGKGRKSAYLSEVAYFDRQLGDLMEYLESDGWLDDTLVVFFSDHGEGLGEKGYYGHHVYLDGWMVDVPLVLWHASLEPARPSVGVSLADIAPTVLHFLGLPQPADLSAESLFALEPNARGRASFSEAFPVRGEALFDSFRLRALDEASIRDRFRSIRVASKGYEPKGAIALDNHRLIHHRSADATLVYERTGSGPERRLTGGEQRKRSALLRRELERWEREQLRRIRCRLRVDVQP